MYTPTAPDRVFGSAPLRRRQALGRLLAHLLARIEITGLERVPSAGPVVLAVNHRDFLDGPLLFAFMRRPVSFLVKTEAYTPRATPFLTTTGSIPVVRTRLDVGAVRQSLRILDDGGVIGLFPEGTRGDGLVRTVRPGVGYFALRTGAKVVPIACHGTDSLMHRRSVRRPAVRITVGEALDFGMVPAGRRVARRDVLAAAEQVRVALAELVTATAPDAPTKLAA